MNSNQELTIRVGDVFHLIGKIDCKHCAFYFEHFRDEHYPKPCACGGLIHWDYGDECPQCDVLYNITICDQCGSTEEHCGCS